MEVLEMAGKKTAKKTFDPNKGNKALDGECRLHESRNSRAQAADRWLVEGLEGKGDWLVCNQMLRVQIFKVRQFFFWT